MGTHKHRMKLGYRGTREDGDKNAPLLEEELKKFEGEVDPGASFSHFFDRTISVFTTPHGKKMIKEGYVFRILYDDLPMTLLTRYPGGYTTDSWLDPVYQADGMSEPVEGQRGGWAYRSWDKEKKKLVKIPGYVFWRSCRRKRNESGEKVMLEKGEPASNGEFLPMGLSRRGAQGFYEYVDHYEAQGYGVNDYPCDVKSAILSSCMWDEDKQELLDMIYHWEDPAFQKDSYFCKKIRKFMKTGEGDPELIRNEIMNCSDLSDTIQDNLLLNLNNGIEKHS